MPLRKIKAPAEVCQDQGQGGEIDAFCTDEHSKGPTRLQAGGIQSWDDLAAFTDEFEWMERWRDVLQWKVNSPQRHFEPAHLEAELACFKRESRSLAQSYRSVA